MEKRKGDGDGRQREKQGKREKGGESPSLLPYTCTCVHRRGGEMRKGWQRAREQERKKISRFPFPLCFFSHILPTLRRRACALYTCTRVHTGEGGGEGGEENFSPSCVHGTARKRKWRKL